MATQGPTFPGTGADDTNIGTVTWSNTGGITASGGSAASVFKNFGVSWSTNSIKLVKGGSISGNDKTDGYSWSSAYSSRNYGSSSDLWGLTLTDTDINDSNFGVVFAAGSSPTVSHYLKATNFGFSIPSGATIDGVVVEVNARSLSYKIFNYVFVDFMRITVYYTVGGAFIAKSTIVRQAVNRASTY